MLATNKKEKKRVISFAHSHMKLLQHAFLIADENDEDEEEKEDYQDFYEYFVAHLYD